MPVSSPGNCRGRKLFPAIYRLSPNIQHWNEPKMVSGPRNEETEGAAGDGVRAAGQKDGELLLSSDTSSARKGARAREGARTATWRTGGVALLPSLSLSHFSHTKTRSFSLRVP